MKTLVSGLALAAAGMVAVAPMAPSFAAEGGTRVAENPGMVLLTDGEDHPVCTAVLVSPQHALTFEGPMSCAGATAVRDGDQSRAVMNQKFPYPSAGMHGNIPSKSQAMLVEFDEPVKTVKPAKLSTEVPRAGEKLTIAAFTGDTPATYDDSISTSAISTRGQNAWISWYAHPENMKMKVHTDAGTPILRGDEVVAFTGLHTDISTDAETIANVHEWVMETIAS